MTILDGKTLLKMWYDIFRKEEQFAPLYPIDRLAKQLETGEIIEADLEPVFASLNAESALIKKRIDFVKQLIKSKIGTLDEPFAYLAFAEVAENLEEKIFYLEKFFIAPEPCDKLFDFPALCRRLANLYLDRFDYYNAAKYYELYQKEFDDRYFVNGTLHEWDAINKKMIEVDMLAHRLKYQPADVKAGRLYLKAGTQYAIEFWERQKKKPYYQTSQRFRESVDKELANALLKHSKSYVYKPRKTT